MQLLQTHRSKRHRKRRKLILLAVVAVLGVAGWQAWTELQPRYLLWKQDRALKQAKEFIAKHDAPNAQLALDVALHAVPGRPEAYRVAASMLEQVGAPSAMRIRRAVAQMQPESAEDAAALVMSCLRFQDYNAARDALSNTAPAVAAQPPMLRAALTFAMVTSNAPMADTILAQLKSEVPQDDDLELAQAMLRLRHPRADRREAAQKELEAIAAKQPAKALQIHREFANDALTRGNYPEAKKWLQVILADPAATLADRLQQANIELLVDHRPFDSVYAEIAAHAPQEETEVVVFTQWLLVQNRADQASKWLHSLPDTLQKQPVVRAARADVAAQLGEWDDLSALLHDGAWGPVPEATLRLALAAQTVNSPARPSLRHDTWDLALDSTGGNLAALRVLYRLANVWRWPDEAERTLWSIVHSFPDQTWADQLLLNGYRAKKDTKGMRDVLTALRDADGTVARYQHDWALLTILLDASASWNQAKSTMRQLYESDPKNATYATGYAFALAQAGKGAEALAVAKGLTPAEQEYPPRLPYLAFIFGVAKQREDFARVSSPPADADYLPEEAYLFTRGREELERKPEKKPSSAKPAPAPGV